MGGTDIGIAPVPFDQGHLVQRGGLGGFVLEKYPRTRPALYPQVSIFGIARDRVVAAVEPRCDLHRVLPLLIGFIPQPSLGVDIQQHRAKAADLAVVQPVGQRLNRPRIAKRIGKEFIRIDNQHPMPVRVFAFEVVHPVDTEPRPPIAGIGMPDRDILHPAQVIGTAVVGPVIDKEKVVDPQLSIILQEIREPDFLVPHGADKQDIIGTDGAGVVLNMCQLGRLAQRPDQPPLAPHAHLVRIPKAHVFSIPCAECPAGLRPSSHQVPSQYVMGRVHKQRTLKQLRVAGMTVRPGNIRPRGCASGRSLPDPPARYSAARLHATDRARQRSGHSNRQTVPGCENAAPVPFPDGTSQ